LFFRNESKIDHASIDGHYKEIVLFDGVRRGQSTLVGNNSTMTQHQEQLLHDDVTSRQGQSASVGNGSTALRHQEQLLYDDVQSRRGQSTLVGIDSMIYRAYGSEKMASYEGLPVR
jgi:hypothetical protein